MLGCGLANARSADEPVAAWAFVQTASDACESFKNGDKPSWVDDNVDLLVETAFTTKPHSNVRGQSGLIHTATLQNDSTLTVTQMGLEQDFFAMQIEMSVDERPKMHWVLNKQCVVSHVREIEYITESDESFLHIADPKTGLILISEPLNPPIPNALPNSNIKEPVKVAMVDSGINYQLAEFRHRLARNAQGELIGYDFWSEDERPFDVQSTSSPFRVTRHGTGTASILLREAPFVELVPYRYPLPDMTRMKALVEHAAANGVYIVGIPLGGNKPDMWQSFLEAAEQHPDILFIASAGNNGRNIDQAPIYPAALDLANLLVVTSANDFVLPADRVNWGRVNVDYMLPAENQAITNFYGDPALASGTSYAVPRAAALAARWLQANPTWRAPELIAEFARRYADGMSIRHVGGGYIADPLASDKTEINLTGVRSLAAEPTNAEALTDNPLQLPISIFVLDENWSNEIIDNSVREAEKILAQCNIMFASVTITELSVPEYLRDLKTGPARTLISALDNDSAFKPIKLFYARDTKMLTPFDGEAFGKGNTRTRPWLQDSVWLTQGIKDPGIALAHELFHVLTNSGAHNKITDNLMQNRTSPGNVNLTEDQCATAVNVAKKNTLLFEM